MVSRLQKYNFIATVERELTKLGVEYEVVSEVGGEEFKRFNMKFMLALDCYMPGVAIKFLQSCRGDIQMFGFEYAQKKWSKFITGSLTGKGDS